MNIAVSCIKALSHFFLFNNDRSKRSQVRTQIKHKIAHITKIAVGRNMKFTCFDSVQHFFFVCPTLARQQQCAHRVHACWRRRREKKCDQLCTQNTRHASKDDSASVWCHSIGAAVAIFFYSSSFVFFFLRSSRRYNRFQNSEID